MRYCFFMWWFLNIVFGWSSVSRFMKIGKIMLFAVSLLYVTLVLYQNVLGYKMLNVSSFSIRFRLNIASVPNYKKRYSRFIKL